MPHCFNELSLALAMPHCFNELSGMRSSLVGETPSRTPALPLSCWEGQIWSSSGFCWSAWHDAAAGFWQWRSCIGLIPGAVPAHWNHFCSRMTYSPNILNKKALPLLDMLARISLVIIYCMSSAGIFVCRRPIACGHSGVCLHIWLSACCWNCQVANVEQSALV
eukprot:355947-Chlamydomonas_euryale.AAC.7